MAMMLRSVDLFWPKNIGEVVVVLDKGEEHVNLMLPDYIKVCGRRPRSGCALQSWHHMKALFRNEMPSPGWQLPVIGPLHS
jgi:hypothetical protein